MILIGARECDREAELDEFTLGVDSRLTTPLILLIYNVPDDAVFDLKTLTRAGNSDTRKMAKAFDCRFFQKAIAFLLHHWFRCFTGRHPGKFLPRKLPSFQSIAIPVVKNWVSFHAVRDQDKRSFKHLLRYL